jgi:type IV secretion system protein VirD4
MGRKQRQLALKNAVHYDADRTFLSAEWATDEDLRKAGCFVDNGFLVGFTQSGRPIYFPQTRKVHSFVGGSSGSGKSSQLSTILLSHRNSVICLDNVGELACISAKQRSRFGPVQIVAPYPIFEAELGEFARVGFNPISPRYIDPNDRNMVGVRCAKIACAIVLKEEHTAEQYWANTARQLVTIVIICVVLYFPAHLRNLATVAAIIMGDVLAFARHMMKVSDDPYIRSKLSRYATKLGDSEVKSLFEVIESARTEVEPFTEPAIADCVSRDELDIESVMHGRGSIFVVQPQELVKEMTRFRRLLTTCVLARFMREDAAYANPTLFVIDELFSLGHLEELDLAFTAVRKLNLRLYISIPSVGLLQQMYPDSYKAMLDSCGLKQWCDVSLDDAELVSVMCGEREVVRRAKSVNFSPLYNYQKPRNIDLDHLHVTNNISTERLPLIRPHELCNLKREEQIVFIAEVPNPILAKKRPYYQIPSLRRKARPNPFHSKKAPARRKLITGNRNWKRFLAR